MRTIEDQRDENEALKAESAIGVEGNHDQLPKRKVIQANEKTKKRIELDNNSRLRAKWNKR
jgi:hypothetical protein